MRRSSGPPWLYGMKEKGRGKAFVALTFEDIELMVPNRVITHS
jgi:hypothetical protein